MSLKLTNPVISSSSKKMIVFFFTELCPGFQADRKLCFIIYESCQPIRL